MTMIDNVTRAILKRRFYDCEPDMYGSLDDFYTAVGPKLSSELWLTTREEACVAIAAMRIPTASMRTAFWDADEASDAGFVRGWSAAIDKLLEDA